MPRRESFLQLLLELEGQSPDGSCKQCGTSNGRFRCSDCIGDSVHCQNCVLKQHKLLPFHRIKVWNGKYFAETTLQDQGYVLHLGHGGETCPGVEDPWLDIDGDLPITEDVDILQDNISASRNQKDHVKDSVVNIVHTTGVYKHSVRWCLCPRTPEKAVQLFQMKLFPASHLRPETAFTFDVLEHFHIDAMECKTAGGSFMRKVCRLTNKAFPHKVPVSPTFSSEHTKPIGSQNRERELRRVSRQWRDLQARKWFGFGHNMKIPGNGDLAHFCPACPQPEINLPDDWKNDPDQ